MDSSAYENPEFGFGKSSATLDRTTGICYIHSFEENLLSENLTMAYLTYSQIHELGHKAAEGLGTYSRKLNEGFTDEMTRDLFEKYVFPQDKNNDFFKNRERYIVENKPEKNGIPLTPEDIYYINGDHVLYYEYPIEMRILQRIREQKPAVYNLLRKSLFSGNTLLAGGAIAHTYGPEIASLFSDKNTTSEEILSKLDGENSHKNLIN